MCFRMEREGGFGMQGELAKMRWTLHSVCRVCKDVFRLPDVKIFGNPETVLNRAAVLPGSGKSMTADALRNGAEVISPEIWPSSMGLML